MFSFVPYLDLKWVTVALSSVAMNVTVIAFTTSWTIIHPFLLFQLDFSNSSVLIEQLNNAAIHTFPFVCSFFNFIFLTDAPIYITDVWMTYAVFWTYIPWNYIHYTITGASQYDFITWESPETYYIIVLFVWAQMAIVTVSNTVIAITSQFVAG